MQYRSLPLSTFLCALPILPIYVLADRQFDMSRSDNVCGPESINLLLFM